MTRNAPPVGAEHSRFAQRIARRYGQEYAFAAGEKPFADAQLALYARLRSQGQELGAALRITRQAVLAQVLRLDCEAHWPLAEVTQAMTELAEWSLQAALAHASAELQLRHGAPQGAQGAPCGLCVLAMGKFGARELNVSSDIDLIYIY